MGDELNAIIATHLKDKHSKNYPNNFIKNPDYLSLHIPTKNMFFHVVKRIL